MGSLDCTITTNRTSARNRTVIWIYLTINHVIYILVVPLYLSFFFTRLPDPNRGSTEKWIYAAARIISVILVSKPSTRMGISGV